MNESGPVPVVIKVGGSVLRSGEDYRRVARHLAPRVREGVWVVVSAGYGITDELLELATHRSLESARALIDRHGQYGGEPLTAVLCSELEALVRSSSVDTPALVTWGERASAFVLREGLAREGVGLPVVELPSDGPLPTDGPAIVPGFYLRTPAGGLQLLPRGGSDISAVLLATRLRAKEVRFWKRGGGLRPTGDETRVLAEVDGNDLLDSLGAYIRPLHPEALRLALRAGMDILLEEPMRQSPPTRIRCRPVASVRIDSTTAPDRRDPRQTMTSARWRP